MSPLARAISCSFHWWCTIREVGTSLMNSFASRSRGLGLSGCVAHAFGTMTSVAAQAARIAFRLLLKVKPPPRKRKGPYRADYYRA